MFTVNEIVKAAGGSKACGNNNAVARGISIDSRTIAPGDFFIAIKGHNFDGHLFIEQAVKKGATGVLFQGPHSKPKLKKDVALIKVKDTTRALGDIARFHRQRFNIPVIAVTGSNGKTTTKEMIAWVLSARFKVRKNPGTKNNQIGVPLTLLGLDRTFDLAVLEIGTSHFGEVAYLTGVCRPDIAVITNIGPSHLEYFGDLRGVLKEKAALMEGLKSPGIAVLNADDVFLKGKTRRLHPRSFILGVGIKNQSDFFASNIQRFSQGIQFVVNRKYRFTLKTLGVYNITNALMALALGRVLGIGWPELQRRLASFDFPENRLEFLSFNHTSFINDTYNSNPLSSKEALTVLDDFAAKGRKIFVMGDMLELGKQAASLHREIGQMAARICDVLIAVGPLSKLAAQSASKLGLARQNIFVCENNLQARDILFSRVVPERDDVVLVKGSRGMMLEKIFRS